MSNDTIDRFKGTYAFLSNFYPCQVTWSGYEFHSVEAAYVAAKSENPRDWERLSRIVKASLAKKIGRRLKLRKDWDQVKLEVMAGLLQQKFSRPDLAEKLLATGDAELIEGNTWGDTFWGVCDGVGANNLGRLLMELRAQLATASSSGSQSSSD